MYNIHRNISITIISFDVFESQYRTSDKENVMLAYRIQSLPDLTLNKYSAYADSGIEGMLEAQTRLVRQMRRIALLGNVRIQFIYEYDPDLDIGEKIRIYIAFQTEDKYFQKQIVKFISSSGISSYFDFVDCDIRSVLNKTYKTKAILYKNERELHATIQNADYSLYIVPKWDMNDDGRLYQMFKMMQSFDQRCCYCVNLSVEPGMEEAIHDSLSKPLKMLRNISGSSQGISELSKYNTEKRDPAIEEARKQYEDWLKVVETSTVFYAGISVLSDDPIYSQLLLDSALTESVSSGGGTIKLENDCSQIFNSLNEIRMYCASYAPRQLSRWPTTYTVEEIAPFIRLPVLYDGECIELPKETAPSFVPDGIVLGKDNNEADVKIPLSLFPKHMFVCGVPGSGKTNTMLHLANSLWNYEYINNDGEREKANIPFLVFEPAKKEYRELALFDIPELLLFSPSANTLFPIAINPFEFPIGLTLSEHIGNLCRVFEGSFPMGPPAPMILDKAIQIIYENLGWKTWDINTGNKEYPILSDLYKQFEIEMDKTNYAGEIRSNIQAVLEMRIGSLLRREMKEIFDVEKSTLSPDEWMRYPAIIELEALGEGPANFMTLLLCTLVRENLKVDQTIQPNKKVKHVIFIEEAHNLIASKSQSDSPEDSNPKIAATTNIVKMLAEVRALKEGIIIADQLPTALAPEIIKNTNIKLVHRLTSADDRGLVGSTMSASEMQMENIATYTPGKGLIAFEKLLRPFELQVQELQEHSNQTPTDAELLRILCQKPGYRRIRERIINRSIWQIRVYVDRGYDAESNFRTIIFKHFGSSCTKEELNKLKALGKKEVENFNDRRAECSHRLKIHRDCLILEELIDSIQKEVNGLGKALEKQLEFIDKFEKTE